MREETYNYAFLMKIYEEPDDDSHEKAYWAYWRIIRYDPDSSMVYLKPHDASGRIDLGKKYLFCEFSYTPDEGPGEYTVNYTNIKPYPLAERGEEYDPPDGIKLCAKYNATVYRKARNKWIQLEESKQGPVSSRLSNLIAYHQRIVADCREWFRVSFPQYLSELSGKPHESEKTAYARFEELVRLAQNAGPQSDDELWEWKRRFDEFSNKKSYFRRYEDRNEPLSQGQGAGNGLEWRTNQKFRKRKQRKSKLRT